MKRRTTRRTGTPLLCAIAPALFAMATGCASPPGALEDARNAYRDAANDPLVQEQAPVALYEAEQTLRHAEREWERDENRDESAHLARLAQTRVEIARIQARHGEAQEQIEQLGEEREQVLIEARRQEIDTARMLAQQGQRAAVRERQRADQLEDQLEELRDMQPQETERGLVLTLGSDVLFAFDRDELKPGSERSLQRLAEFLQEHPERDLLIEGYTDSVGSEAYNQELSRRRADAVREFLVRSGIEPGRLTVRGYGESYPRVANDSPEARQMNRRVEVVVLDRGQQGEATAQRGPERSATPAALPGGERSRPGTGSDATGMDADPYDRSGPEPMR